MAQRARGEGSVYQRKDGYWCASVRLPGGRRVTKYRANRKEAGQALADMTTRARRGRLAAPSKVTVAAWLAEWLAARHPNLRPTTYRNYTTATRLHIEPTLGTIRLSRLTPQMVERVVVECASEHPYMAKLVRQVLRMACAKAVVFGLLGSNPVDPVEVPVAVAKDRRRWGPDELARFLDASHDDRLAALWAVLAGTGLRLGEALGLEWPDLDLEDGSLHVERSLASVGGDAILGPPKTRSGRRTVALPDFARQALRHWRARQAAERLQAGPAWSDTRRTVFTEPGGSPPSQGQVWRRFQKACDLANVPRMRVHDLRHVHASLAIASGADPKVVQARLGHSTLDMTLGVYAHATGEGDRRLAEAMQAQLGGTRE